MQNNLLEVKTFLRNGDPKAAYSRCQDMLKLNPFDARLLNLAGIAAFQIGLPDASLSHLKASVAYDATDSEAQTNLGNILSHFGSYEDASAAYKKAIKNDPNYPEAYFNYGIMLQSLERDIEAVHAFENTLERNPSNAMALHGIGNSLRKLGRLVQSKAAFERSLKLEPNFEASRINLAAVLHELGDFKSAIRQCRRLLKKSPDLVEAKYNLALNCQEQGQFEEAILNYEQILFLEPGHAAAAMNMACAFQEKGELEKATAAFEMAIELDPEFAQLHANFSDLSLQKGNVSEAINICDEFLMRNPGNTTLLAQKAIALYDGGDGDEASGLLDYDRFLHLREIASAGMFENLEDFNSALCKHIQEHPSLMFSPRSHATRYGKHSGELLVEPKGPVAFLEHLITEEVNEYRSKILQSPNHPFINVCPGNFKLSVWGVVMRDKGHQISHIHPAAWLSGVYYPKVPDIVSEKENGNAGWLMFGRPPEHFHNKREPEKYFVCPRPGLMVLFPSYFYHQTIPFNSDDTRVSVAFDVY